MGKHDHQHQEHVSHEAAQHENVEATVAAESAAVATAAPSANPVVEAARAAYQGALAEFKVARQKVIDTRTDFKAKRDAAKAAKAAQPAAA